MLANSKNQLTLSKPDSFGTDSKPPLKSDVHAIKSQIKKVAKAGTNSRGLFYQSVRLWGKITDTLCLIDLLPSKRTDQS